MIELWRRLLAINMGSSCKARWQTDVWRQQRAARGRCRHRLDPVPGRAGSTLPAGRCSVREPHYAHHDAHAGYPGKRLLDLVITVPAMLVLAPVYASVTAVVAVWMGRPVLFSQARAGFAGEPFQIYKFRTMREAYDASGRPLPDGERLTRAGRLLRATSLDELPELFNVLTGEMSLVGPRPLPMRYLPYYSERESLRFALSPGMTGLAQVSGRNSLPWDERLECDAVYVENSSLWLDVLILARTLGSVVSGRNVEVDTGNEGDLREIRRSAGS
jgi:sugar transferase EpsL